MSRENKQRIGQQRPSHPGGSADKEHRMGRQRPSPHRIVGAEHFGTNSEERISDSNSESFGEKAVKELLDNHDFKFSRSMGQNFLVDENITDKIVRMSGIDKSCGVVEIGPGIGSLTYKLSKAAGRVAAIELDKRLESVLAEKLAFAENNVKLIFGDVLKIDLQELVHTEMQGLVPRVCANLPYSITSPVLTRLIGAEAFEEITVMLQKEVAQRICSSPGSRAYGALTVFVQYHMSPEMLFDVPPSCFIPKPKVDSTVITMKKKAKTIASAHLEKAFFKIVRAAFGQRRKTLQNALFAAFGSTMSKDEIAACILSCGFKSDIRGEMLGIDEFAALAERMDCNNI